MHAKRLLLLIASGAGFALLIAVASWVVLGKFRPEVEMARMRKAMAEVATVRERAAFSWTRGEGKERTTTSVYLTGQTDLSMPDVLQYASKFRLFRLSASKDYADLSGEIRRIAGTTYLAYAPPGPEVAGISFKKAGTWVSFRDGERDAWGPVIPGMEVPGGEGTSGNGQEAGREWTGEALVRLRELLARADVFVVRYDDVTEMTYGHASRIIEARFDPDALRSFLLDLVRAKEGLEPTPEERLRVERQAAVLERLSFRLWIGMDDHRLYRVQAAGSAGGGVGCESLVVSCGSIDAIIELYDFDDPFDAVAPVAGSTISFSSVVSSLGAGIDDGIDEIPGVDGVTFVANDSARLPVEQNDVFADADHDGLSAAVEAFYLTNPNVADTDGDGATDGEEVLSGRNPRGEGTLFGFGLGIGE